MQNRFGLGLAVAAILCFAEEPAGPRIMRPADQSILKPGPVSFVARAPGKAELQLDGKPLPATEPAAGVLTATVSPTAGPHELALVSAAGEHRLRFFVSGSSEAADAPAGWRAYRVHPPRAVCETCHAVEAGAWSIKGATPSANCFGCHNRKTFPEPHSHNSETLAECQLCHDPHGSREKSHLKMPRETACKLCHG